MNNKATSQTKKKKTFVKKKKKLCRGFIMEKFSSSQHLLSLLTIPVNV